MKLVRGPRIYFLPSGCVLMDGKQLDQRLNLVEVFMHDQSLRTSLRESFKRAPDFSRILKRLQRGGKLEDCVRLYYFCETLPTLHELFQNYQGPHDRFVRSRYTDTMKVRPLPFLLWFLRLILDVVPPR